MSTNKIAIRVDASIQIGIGHVMRCLTLADVLKAKGIECHFICREHPGNLIAEIEIRGHKVHRLIMLDHGYEEKKFDSGLNTHSHWLGSSWQTDAEMTASFLENLIPEWLVVDHYGLDFRWESAVRKYCNKLMVIDDLADRKHDCDLLLDQTFGRKDTDYENLVSDNSELLLGAQYALLRPEFLEWRVYSLIRRTKPRLKQILVSMGGVDPDNVTGRVLEALSTCELSKDVKIIVVMGATAPHIEAVKRQAESMLIPTEVKVNVTKMAELMSNSDLAIGAAGATTWERCCLGLPTIQIVIADNQEKNALELSSINAVFCMKTNEIFSLKNILKNIETKLAKLSLLSSSILDGNGTQSVVNVLSDRNQVKPKLELRPMKDTDCQYLYDLQATPGVRKFSKVPKIPEYTEHKLWFEQSIESSDKAMFIIMENLNRLGMLRLDSILKDQFEVSIIVDPKYSGKGIAQRAIQKLVELIPGRIIKAIVHANNIASQKVFEKTGFQLQDRSQLFWTYINYA